MSMIHPPSYASYTSSVLPPDKVASTLTLNDSYPLRRIAATNHKSLVNESDILAHLDLISVFHKVHHGVQDGGVEVDALRDLPITSAVQTVFLARAQHRFDLWTEKVLKRPGRDLGGSLLAEEIPPVDVLMFLHAYMLRPLCYYEDLLRVYPCLVGVGSFPLKAVESLIDRNKMDFVPTAGQIRLWESLTSTHFGPPLKTLPTEVVDIQCPRCLVLNTIPWVNDEGTGAGQMLSGICVSCGISVNSDALSVRKFLQDMVSQEILPHTIFNDKDCEDLESAQVISEIIRTALNISNTTEGDRFEWKMNNVKTALLGCTDVLEIVGDHRLAHLLSAYDHPSPSSFDLKSAVMRQAVFINTMHDVQWAGDIDKYLTPGNDTLILNAINRYHQYFLRSEGRVIPSLDVDMVFHTHLLSAASYINDCNHTLGHVLDHDDSMAGSEFEQDLLQAIEAWKNMPQPIAIYAPARCTPFGPPKPGPRPPPPPPPRPT